MQSKFSLMPGFNIRELSNGSLFLLSEGNNYCVQDPFLIEIIKYLREQENSVPLEEIHSRLQNLGLVVSPEKLQTMTKQMIEFSLITSQQSSLPYHLQALLYKIGSLPQVAEEKLKLQKVTVSSFSNCPIGELEEILHRLGVQTGQDGQFRVLIVDDYLNTRIQDFSQSAEQTNTPWMLVKPHGCSLWVGPIFRPGQPSLPSYESLALRLKEHRCVETDALGPTSEHFNLPNLIALPNVKAIGFNILAMETLKWIVSETSGLISNILTFDCTDLTVAFHYVDHHPCAKDSLSKQAINSNVVNLLLHSSLKTFFDAEGERTRSPEETWKTIEHLVSPITGLISKIYYQQENNYHIYYGPRCLNFPGSHAGHFRSPEIVVGKSTNLLKARVGCIAEAIERYFSANHHLHHQYAFTYKEIAHDSIHPHDLLNFSPLQYAQREMINAKFGPFQWVPLPFDETKKIHWLRISSLNSSKESYLPAAYCYMNDYDQQEHLMCPGDTNGCACGNSLEEALFYGISEIIERDALAIWWYNRLTRPTVDLDSFSNHAIRTISNGIKAQGRDLRVIDISTDLDIPAFVAVSWKNDGSRIVFGASAHLDPQVGIVRALSELHQVFTRANVPENIDISSIVPAERDLVHWLIYEKVEHHPFLHLEKEKKSHADYPRVNHKDFLDDLHFYFKQFHARSLDIYALNLTPLNAPMAVVKVIVPTMRHFWARYGEGRLFQVPISLGDRMSPLHESELNPIPYFL